MRAFIVRPFGKKEGIDFDAVEADLISPALDELGIGGRTTIEILGQGNIRTDMFHLLLTADLVIADLSIHNANVFYELGIRHAFCDRHTFLIKSSGDEVPFDLKTDRYFSYQRDHPGDGVKALTAALRQTLDSEDADSPVFQLIPDLKAQDRAGLVKVPADFREEVTLARARKAAGDLALLAEEVLRFGLEWAEEGLREVGEAQFRIKDFGSASETWETIRRRYQSDDPQANQRLATIFQKTGDLARSDQAVERALACSDCSVEARAELHALHGSNEKTRWLAEWQGQPAERRAGAALISPFLARSLDAYSHGFSQDVNHYYSGLNALALATIQEGLARAHEEVWADGFETDEEAAAKLHRLSLRRQRLAGAVEFSLEAARSRLARIGGKDSWLEVSRADFTCLTSKRPARVGRQYRQAIAEIPPFDLDSVIRQLVIFENLGVLVDNVGAALEVLRARQEGSVRETKAQAPARVLVFTGHRIDAPDREAPRFPPRAEGKARAMIRDAVAAELEGVDGDVIGYAGGASGGDILFHEVCEELGVATRLFLAGPRDDYVRASVQEAGPDWVRRFDQLHARLESQTRVLSDRLELPRWLRSAPDYSIWQRNNLWELENGLMHGSASTTLVALWNGEPGDNAGGTEDMVRMAQERGARTVILDAGELVDG